MKKFISRLTTTLMAVFTMALILVFPTTIASATDAPVSAAVVESNIAVNAVQPMVSGAQVSSVIVAASAETAYANVMGFFLVWIRRIGAAVALIGALLFGFAIKNDDADRKQTGLMTMAAGFIVWAICTGADMFNLFG